PEFMLSGHHLGISARVRVLACIKIPTGCTESDVGGSQGLVYFLDCQQRRGSRVNKAGCAHSDGEARSSDIVEQTDNHHHVICAECKVDAVQLAPEAFECLRDCFPAPGCLILLQSLQ